MSDASLSRRARRDMEAQAAERAAAEGDPTWSPTQGISMGEIPSVDTSGQAFSRRDRRRVERLGRPMESWTAEEEMIATGQIPTMTPERIVEQERLAREAAATAAVDAQTASSELRILAQRDVDRERRGESVAPPEPAPRPNAAAEVPTMAEPYSPRFELDDREGKSARDESQSVEIPTGFASEAKFERTPAPTGEPDPYDAGGQPLTWPEGFEAILAPPSEEPRPARAAYPAVEPPVFQASSVEPSAPAQTQGAAEAPEVRQSDVEARQAEAASARAKVFEELFPPGSSQAALLDHDQREREAAEVAGSIEPGGSEPLPDHDEEAERNRGIEEFRRLTEAAITSIERTPQGQYESPQSDASPMPDPGALAPPSGESPVVSAPFQSNPSASGAWAPHQATFDETVRAASTEIPVRPMNQPQPTYGQEPSPWGSHPLDAAQASAPHDVNNFEPVSDVPRPDFSQLTNVPSTGQFPATGNQAPATGQFPATGALFTSDPSVTGQIAPLRRTPDLPPVGGAKHFKWLHLAVIGALVFVLGVVIYNLAWGQ